MYGGSYPQPSATASAAFAAKRQAGAGGLPPPPPSHPGAAPHGHGASASSTASGAQAYWLPDRLLMASHSPGGPAPGTQSSAATAQTAFSLNTLQAARRSIGGHGGQGSSPGAQPQPQLSQLHSAGAGGATVAANQRHMVPLQGLSTPGGRPMEDVEARARRMSRELPQVVAVASQSPTAAKTSPVTAAAPIMLRGHPSGTAVVTSNAAGAAPAGIATGPSLASSPTATTSAAGYAVAAVGLSPAPSSPAASSPVAVQVPVAVSPVADASGSRSEFQPEHDVDLRKPVAATEPTQQVPSTVAAVPGAPAAAATSQAAVALSDGSEAVLRASAPESEDPRQKAEDSDLPQEPAKHANVEDLECRLNVCEEELSRERRMGAELTEQVEQLRSYAAEFERTNQKLRCNVEHLEEAQQAQGTDPSAAPELQWQRRAEAAEEALAREQERCRQHMQELEHYKVDGASLASGNGIVATSLGGDAADVPEVRLLRAELAKRDRELLAASTARRRTADQSERVAAALRAKLAELEAAVAATPSTSSRASSPQRSETSDRGDRTFSDRGSPFQAPSVERGVQTEVPPFEIEAHHAAGEFPTLVAAPPPVPTSVFAPPSPQIAQHRGTTGTSASSITRSPDVDPAVTVASSLPFERLIEGASSVDVVSAGANASVGGSAVVGGISISGGGSYATGSGRLQPAADASL